jgi:urease subunit beta/urease subunit gamma/beta
VNTVIPGEWLIGDEPIEINAGRPTARLLVRNTGDRPIQVGSHFHFFEVNRALDFDRRAALGMRLDVPSGQSVRFEAGDEREVGLVAFGGARRVTGFSNLLNGATAADRAVHVALQRAARFGFATVEPSAPDGTAHAAPGRKVAPREPISGPRRERAKRQ